MTNSDSSENPRFEVGNLAELGNLDCLTNNAQSCIDGLNGERMSIKATRPLSKPLEYNVYNINRQSNNIGQ